MDSRQLLEKVTELRATFEKHFENPWFFTLLEGVPVDPLLIKDVRDFLKIEESWAITEARSREGIRNLELFVLTLRHYLLPSIKERLRISPLRPDMMITDKDQKAIRALIAYSIPIKVEILDGQIQDFKRYLGTEEKPNVTGKLSESYTNASA